MSADIELNEAAAAGLLWGLRAIHDPIYSVLPWLVREAS